MRVILTLILTGALSFQMIAQAPAKMSYQAVVRDASFELVTTQFIGMKISILQGSATGTIAYSETYSPNPQTNANGLVTVEIGSGVPGTGTFAAIDWASGPWFLKVETDTQGGTAYQITGTSQLLSVPFAFYAEKAGNGFSGNYNDLINKPTLFDGTWTSLTGIPAGFADGLDDTDDADNSITNEIQALSLAGNVLTLSKEGGTVTIPGDNWGTQTVLTDATLAGNGTTTSPLQIARQTAIAGQVLKWNGSTWMPSDDDTSSVPKLTLPYKGRSADENFLFHMINDGQGGGIRGETTGSTGLLGLASGTLASNIGTAGQSASPSGVGIWGNNIALTGNGIAVKGSVQATTGYSGFFERGRFYIEGNTGIGTLNPAAKLDVAGQVKITGGSPGSGKVLTSDANGLASWQTPAEGFSLPYSGNCNSADAAFAINQAGTGNGIYVYNPGTTGDIKGIEVSFNSVTGTGVAAYAHAGGGTTNGILGVTASSNGTGVKGIASHTSGDNFGVFGESKSSEGTAVWGYNTSATGIGIGIRGSVTSASGFSGFFTGGKFYVGSNVGIGMLDPSQKLHIKGSAAGNAVLLIEPNKWTSAGDYGELRFGDTNHYIRGEHTKGMTFNDANKFCFSGGNVGIGYDNPAAKLDVSASQGPNIIIRDSDGGAGRPGIQFVNNYIHYISGDDSDNEIFGFYAGYGDTRTYAARVNIHGPATGNWGKHLSLTHDGSHGRIGTDAGYLVLEPAGNRVGLGTDAPTQSLDVNGTLRVRTILSGTTAGALYRTSDGSVVISSSDARLKENIEPLNNSLEKVLQLTGVRFSWKGETSPGKNIGFIAQDFERVIPELVFTNDVDGYKGVNYAEVSAVLVEAIKELKAENNLLKAENIANSAEIRLLREEIKRIIVWMEKAEAPGGVQAGENGIAK